MEDDNPFEKAQTVDPEVRAYVYSLVNALGGSSAEEDGRYALGDDALACLRDLKRWLKLYDEKTNRLDVARCLAEAKLVNGDLLPILASWPEDNSNDKLKSRVALACLELLVPLTWPLENGGEMTRNHHRHTPHILQAQVLYKAGVLGHDTCSIIRQIIRIGLPSIAMPKDERTSRDEGILKLMLYFIRNIAVIHPMPNLPNVGLDIEISRSATIEAFRQQDVFALLLTMCSNIGEDFNLQDVIILEILFNLIKGIEVDKLWMTEQQRQGREVSDLKDALTIEKGMHRDYKRSAPTRHNRFGTMIWVKREDEKMSAVSGQENLKDGQNALFNMDKTKKWNKPQQRRKDIEHTIYDFDRSVRLTSSASQVMRNFVEEFLDSGFNPLFSHLRKAIEREAERILEVNCRQFFYTVSWFLQAERARRLMQRNNNKTAELTEEFEQDSFSLVASVFNQETFITLNRYMQTSYDNKEWQDLNASMRCFTQILLTVQEMAQSPLEEDQEIADNIQNRIFYEETTHDRIVSILRGYKDQGFGYLDACTELSHVFLRLLERYSKENVDLQIRSRRRARQKKKEQKQQLSAEGNGDDEDEQSENEDIADVAQVTKERKFDFHRFAAKFTSQSSVNTYVAFTTFYRELSVDQLKRAHRFFHRVAFKQELAVLLYRVDIMALFYKMIKGPEGLDTSHLLYKDWMEFSRQLFKKMFKKLDQRPELLVEMLFSKISSTLYYLEYGHEKQTLASSRVPAELEVRPSPGRGMKEQIAIAVAVLKDDDKAHLAQWVQLILQKAFDERQGWELEEAARKERISTESVQKDGEAAEGTKEVNVPEPSYITVRPASDEIRTAMLKSARLRLLMKLVGFNVTGDEDVAGSSWIIPGSLTASQLEQAKLAVEQSLQTTWMPENEDDAPEDLLRRVRTVTAEDNEGIAQRDAFINDSEGDDAVEEFLFPDNIRSKWSSKNAMEEIKQKHRKRRHEETDPLDDDIVEERRRRREEAALERRRKMKSELYIHDSDDETDEERDKDFFRREEEGKKRQNERVRQAMDLASRENKGRGDKKKSRLQEHVFEQDDSDEVVAFGDNHDIMQNDDTASSQLHLAGTDDELAEDEDTPLSSQSSAERKKTPGVERPLPKMLQPRMPSFTASALKQVAPGESSDEEEEEIIVSARRRARAGFIVDSSDDE